MDGDWALRVVCLIQGSGFGVGIHGDGFPLASQRCLGKSVQLNDAADIAAISIQHENLPGSPLLLKLTHIPLLP